MNGKNILGIGVVIVALAAAFFAGRYLGETSPNDSEISVRPLAESSTVVEIRKDQDGAAEPVAGETPAMVAAARPVSDLTFRELQQVVIDRCAELENNRDYIKAYSLKNGLYQRLLAILKNVAYTPPVVSGETQDLYVLLSNASHFYRVMGKENILLLREILNNEHGKVESDLALVFNYMLKSSRSAQSMIKFEQLYEYAAYFLNTMGGSSYLARRDVKTATLVRYYAVLIVHEADLQGVNRHGIDVLPALRLVRDDLQQQNDLTGLAVYLDNLDRIRSTYKR